MYDWTGGVLKRTGTARLLHREHVLEDERVFGENSLVESKFDPARYQNDRAIVVPELRIAKCATVIRLLTKPLSVDGRRHRGRDSE